MTALALGRRTATSTTRDHSIRLSSISVAHPRLSCQWPECDPLWIHSQQCYPFFVVWRPLFSLPLLCPEEGGITAAQGYKWSAGRMTVLREVPISLPFRRTHFRTLHNKLVLAPSRSTTLHIPHYAIYEDKVCVFHFAPSA